MTTTAPEGLTHRVAYLEAMVTFPWQQRRVTERQLIIWVLVAVMLLNLALMVGAVILWL